MTRWSAGGSQVERFYFEFICLTFNLSCVKRPSTSTVQALLWLSFVEMGAMLALVEVTTSTIKFLGRAAIFPRWITAPSEAPRHIQKMPELRIEALSASLKVMYDKFLGPR